MRCPSCDSPEYRVFTSKGKSFQPRDMELGTLRRHACLTCSRTFYSIQTVLSSKLAELILDEMEENQIRRQTSSVLTQLDSASRGSTTSASSV